MSTHARLPWHSGKDASGEFKRVASDRVRCGRRKARFHGQHAGNSPVKMCLIRIRRRYASSVSFVMQHASMPPRPLVNKPVKVLSCQPFWQKGLKAAACKQWCVVKCPGLLWDVATSCLY